MRGAHELHHDGDATEHEQAVEDSLPDAAEVEQSGERPAAGEGGAEHLGADQDGGADHGDDVEPDDAAVASGHEDLPAMAAINLNPAAGSSPAQAGGGSGAEFQAFDLAHGGRRSMCEGFRHDHT